MRRSCWRMMSPHSWRQAQMRRTISSRPRSCRVLCSCWWILRSTTACVAMPAWSVPGTHRVFRPCMRRQRIRISCSVLLSAWPRCRRSVTLGGGMTIVKGSPGRRPRGGSARPPPTPCTAAPRRRPDRRPWPAVPGRGGDHRRQPGWVQAWALSLSRVNLYSMLSTRACQEASMMFSETPTVPQCSLLSRDSMTTRTLAAVPAPELMTRTL